MHAARSHSLIRRLALTLSILVISALAVGLWAFYGRNTPHFETTRSVKIPPGSGFRVIEDSLESAGLLSSRLTFEGVAFVTGWYQDLKPGYYEFEQPASNAELLRRLRKGLQTPLRVTIPPGTRPGVVAAVFESRLDIDSTRFRETLFDPALLTELDVDSAHIFGYMLPETYFFFWDTGPRAAVRRVKEEFDRFFDESKRARADSLGLTIDEVIRLASIVEWEARLPEERPRVAGVYLNRLRIGMPLQADPTVQFALMQSDGGRMRRLLFRDYRFSHPYNTYLYRGLPPGPITNPSPSSIRAVLDAEQHDYLYFVADGTGAHTFSRTLREHNNAAARYRDLMRERRREQSGG